MKKFKSVLITGCAGFIGSHVTDEFLAAGYRVVGYDSFTYAAKETNLNKARSYSNFKLIKGDINDFSFLSSIIKEQDIDCVINLAAETHVDNSIKCSDTFLKTNIFGVKNILDICKANNIFFVQFSTDEVYGVSTDGTPFIESSPLNPKNPYSATKAAADHLIASYANTYGLKYLILRPSNNFGARQHKEKFIPTIFNSLLTNKKIPIYGLGNQIREWTPATETAKATRFIVENSPNNEIYNITSELFFENKKVVEIICDVLKLNYLDCITFVPDRPGHDMRYAISSCKLTNLGYKVKVNFIDTLKDIIKTDFVTLTNVVQELH
jgi:dTDP-glucose 4,6-dehydratase